MLRIVNLNIYFGELTNPFLKKATFSLRQQFKLCTLPKKEEINSFLPFYYFPMDFF